jgi:ubiquitin-like modifier-activating enzyme ATG7
VDLLQSTKVLIIGAGTLGCSVARVLLGWGVRKIKFVDYGKVSYSNPVRQSLFSLDDCHHDGGSGRPKAQAAADALKTIAADVESEGIMLSIPMPAHPEKNQEEFQNSVETLDQLVQECDVVFLLTDTRESRWLPTVMAAAHDKILINAALGLDSWLVMRHGGCENRTNRFGCYFCNDIVAPDNSTRNRTLDQQCTVTRPGLAPIASSMAVEMMVSLLHHPDRLDAPAPPPATSFSPTVSGAHTSTLGVVPHQIRGSLVSYTMMTPSVPAFQFCTGCSAPVINAYRTDKIGTVLQVCDSADAGFLETMSGLSAFRAEAAEKVEDIVDWDEEEE